MLLTPLCMTLAADLPRTQRAEASDWYGPR